MTRLAPRNVLLGTLLAGLIVFAGCYTSKYAIVAPDKAKVDRALVGNWNSDAFSSDGREAGLIVRNIDDKQYYAEWRMKEAGELTRTVGNTTDIRGTTFIQLRGLEADGSIQDEWVIMRLDLSKDTLKIRQLDDDFMKKQTIGSSEQLRAVLDSNLNNPAMYTEKEAITATRVVPK